MMTPERLVEIRTLILSVRQDSLTLDDTRINMLVVDPNALVRALDDLLAEVERLKEREHIHEIHAKYSKRNREISRRRQEAIRRGWNPDEIDYSDLND